MYVYIDIDSEGYDGIYNPAKLKWVNLIVSPIAAHLPGDILTVYQTGDDSPIEFPSSIQFSQIDCSDVQLVHSYPIIYMHIKFPLMPTIPMISPSCHCIIMSS